jgi:hypothetical protein
MTTQRDIGRPRLAAATARRAPDGWWAVEIVGSVFRDYGTRHEAVAGIRAWLQGSDFDEVRVDWIETTTYERVR